MGMLVYIVYVRIYIYIKMFICVELRYGHVYTYIYAYRAIEILVGRRSRYHRKPNTGRKKVLKIYFLDDSAVTRPSSRGPDEYILYRYLMQILFREKKHVFRNQTKGRNVQDGTI